MFYRTLFSLVLLAGSHLCLWQMFQSWDKTHVPPISSTVLWPAEAASTLVMLDPGHGGHDGGTGGFGALEKSLALAITEKVRQKLVQKGLLVQMTRETDVYISLEDRVAISKKNGAKIFVSIHLNADATSAETAGVETYFSSRRPLGDLPKVRQQVGLAAGTLFKDERSQLLAGLLQSRIVKQTGSNDRQVRDSSFYVVQHNSCPAVLIECGYLTNLDESTKLQNSAHHEKLATAIADGIYHFVIASVFHPRRGILIEEGAL